MIFLTVGSQTPFDRLLRIVDDWCAVSGQKVVAQIGEGEYEPRYMEWFRSVTPAEFRKLCMESSFIVAHAGMGTVLTAMELRKPIVLFPRSAKLMETRNEHQLATARWLGQRPGISIAFDAAELVACLNQAPSAGGEAISSEAQSGLLQVLRVFIAAPR